MIEADWPMTHSLPCSGPVKSFALDFQITLRFTSKLKQTASGWPEAEWGAAVTPRAAALLFLRPTPAFVARTAGQMVRRQHMRVSLPAWQPLGRVCVCLRERERETSWLGTSEAHESPCNSAARRQKLLAGREQGVSLGGVMSPGFISTGSEAARALMNSGVASGSAGLCGSPRVPAPLACAHWKR